jgi:poly-gamma-glutamate synthesis protein (capsule biosynthesis protein)
MPRRLHRARRPIGCAVSISLIVIVVGGGLAAFGYERWQSSQGLAPTADVPASPSPSPSPTPERQITILGAGDVIAHPEVWAQARLDGGGNGYDFFPIFQGVSETISHADLALCHLETPVASKGATPSGYPLFNAPPEVLDGVQKAGFDGCSTASNHAMDQGAAGVARTLDAMDKAGLGHAGTARTADEAQKVTTYDLKGVKVAHLAYSYGFGVNRPAGKEWMANLIDRDAIKKAASQARAAGAQIVLVSLHWGTEGEHLPDDNQDHLSQELLASPDIDLIFGHHAHSVQAMERINGKWVAYGLGNLLARHSENLPWQREGVMARMTLTEQSPGKWQVTKAEAIATWTDETPKLRLLELPKVIGTTTLSATTRKFHQATLDRIAGYLRLRGADAAGLLILGLGGGSGGSGSGSGSGSSASPSRSGSGTGNGTRNGLAPAPDRGD